MVVKNEGKVDEYPCLVPIVSYLDFLLTFVEPIHKF